MKLFPAIDLYKGCAVRLFKGDYDQMTVYSDNPAEFAAQFEAKGAENLHLVHTAIVILRTKSPLFTILSKSSIVASTISLDEDVCRVRFAVP